MAQDISSWIASSIVQHDKDHGAAPVRAWTGSRFAQLVKFDTYRDQYNPRAQIRGIISDQSHTVKVVFDIAATDIHELPIASGVVPETLTSHLRSIFTIKKFRFRLSPPPPIPSRSTPALEIPQLTLDVLEWDIHSGDRNEPVYFEDAVEVERNGAVQKVLRKWWFGEPTSDVSQSFSTQDPSPLPTAGPSRTQNPISDPRPIRTSLPHPNSPTKASKGKGKGTQLLSTPRREVLFGFLEPQTKQQGGKQPKALGEWMFEVAEEDKVVMNGIGVFALDLPKKAADVVVEEGQHQEHKDDRERELPRAAAFGHPANGSIDGNDNVSSPINGAGVSPNRMEISAAKARRAGHQPAAAADPPSSDYKSPPVPIAAGVNDDSEDDEIPIKPKSKPGIKRRARPTIKDPLDFGSPSPTRDDVEHDSSLDQAAAAVHGVVATSVAQPAAGSDPVEHARFEDPEIEIGYEEEVEVVEEEDEEMLSDYERETRRRAKARTSPALSKASASPARLPSLAQAARRSSAHLQHSSQEQNQSQSLPETTSASPSLPASQSVEEFSLSRYAKRARTHLSSSGSSPSRHSKTNGSASGTSAKATQRGSPLKKAHPALSEKGSSDNEVDVRVSSQHVSSPARICEPTQAIYPPLPNTTANDSTAAITPPGTGKEESGGSLGFFKSLNPFRRLSQKEGKGGRWLFGEWSGKKGDDESREGAEEDEEAEQEGYEDGQEGDEDDEVDVRDAGGVSEEDSQMEVDVDESQGQQVEGEDEAMGVTDGAGEQVGSDAEESEEELEEIEEKMASYDDGDDVKLDFKEEAKSSPKKGSQTELDVETEGEDDGDEASGNGIEEDVKPGIKDEELLDQDEDEDDIEDDDQDQAGVGGDDELGNDESRVEEVDHTSQSEHTTDSPTTPHVRPAPQQFNTNQRLADALSLFLPTHSDTEAEAEDAEDNEDVPPPPPDELPARYRPATELLRRSLGRASREFSPVIIRRGVTIEGTRGSATPSGPGAGKEIMRVDTPIGGRKRERSGSLRGNEGAATEDTTANDGTIEPPERVRTKKQKLASMGYRFDFDIPALSRMAWTLAQTKIAETWQANAARRGV